MMREEATAEMFHLYRLCRIETEIVESRRRTAGDSKQKNYRF